jgi:predicted porin
MKQPTLSQLAFAAALAALGTTAQAQSSVTIYGITDAGFRTANGLTAASAPSAGNTNAVNSGINTTSRLGYRGREDLGGGLYAMFNLESGINVDTGAPANTTKFFDRASIVGVGAGWGLITLGRQTTLLADAVGPVDPLSSRFASFNPNIGIAALSSHGLAQEYGPAGITTGAYRLDNSLKYTGTFSGVSVRAMHALGEQSGNSAKLSSSGVGLGYASGPVTATLGYQRFKTVAELDLKAYVGGVAAKVGNGRLAITYGNSEANTTATAKTRNKTLGLGGTLPVSANLDLVLTHYRVTRSRTGSNDDGFNRTIAFAEYKLSKRSLVYLEADSTQWKAGYNAAGTKGTGTGLSLGVKHTF